MINNKFQVKDIFLLSIEEYKKYEKYILKINTCWWLRSPCYDSISAAYVISGGSVDSSGDVVSNDCISVRPALRISNLSSFNLNPRDIIQIFGIDWIVLDKDLVIAKEAIGRHMFDEESNDYENSKIKKYLHNSLNNYLELTKSCITNDNVEHPKHYTDGKYECIEVMEDVFGIDSLMTFCRLNAFKYLWRSENKNGIEDIQKANWYLNKYIELYKKGFKDE